MRKTMLRLVLFLLSLTILRGLSQEPGQYIVRAKIENGDTLVVGYLSQVIVFGGSGLKAHFAEGKYNKLVNNVKKAYPLAKIAGVKFREYEVILQNTYTDQEKRQLMKQAEQELRDEFEDDVRKLTFSQGIILIKLIDRETGATSFALIQELRGKFLAFFWQTFARIFGYNLKVEYDPYGADKDIEDIVQMIEAGFL
jgi:hypothetical protein